jgi:hypothetical protein
MNIKNTLKMIALFGLNLNADTNPEFNSSVITDMIKGDEKTSINTSFVEEKITILKKIKEDHKNVIEKKKTNNDTSETKLQSEIKITVKNGEKSEDKTFDIKSESELTNSIEKLEKIVKEAKEDEKEKSIVSGDDFKFWTCYKKYSQKDGKLLGILNKTKTAISTGYVLIIAVATYFGITKYNSSSENATEIEVK